MEYIIGAILLFIAFIIFSLIFRKRIYDRVDKLEEWKLHIMNKEVAEELSKVKHLNLSGETEARFEKWRSEWDNIVARWLPDLEEDLFDAEEAADRYRFRTANKVLREVEETLIGIEESITNMYEEVERLLHSEQDTREQVEQLRPGIKEARKELLQNRHHFGKAEFVLELELDEIEAEISSYDELTENGNYFEAEKRVREAKNRLDHLRYKMNVFPMLYKACRNELPEQLEELANGLSEMKDRGFQIQHFGFEQEIHKHHEKLLAMLELLNKGEVEGIEQGIQETDERIKEIYDQLEREVLAKNFTDQKVSIMNEKLQSTSEQFEAVKNEIAVIQDSYHINDQDQEMQYSLENWLSQLKTQADKINQAVNEEKKNYSVIRSELENWLKQWESLHDMQTEYRERIQSLRKHELEAKRKITELKKEISLIRRKLHTSNLPGVPEYIMDITVEAANMIQEAKKHLDIHPLNMEFIQSTIDKAEKNTLTVREQTELLLEEAQLAEVVIQYANRYRSQYPVLGAKLVEAEQAFRNYDYKLALEKASVALEGIEPGATDRLRGLVTN
ncbi:septation ring formation regulator EzrA [Salirhabdus salicampi]|uniref:septation ring formation regulator EzrA n=1 Tax=Salirhabdus salicampi TaxID=476102 RepID=UPI0020C25849|nr:septation ring formation regulator EzrA [Salirhabdus salicampi]MCP8617131.1 septation ring formation regulator EzrA [Salirhabdus salicampi]